MAIATATTTFLTLFSVVIIVVAILLITSIQLETSYASTQTINEDDNVAVTVASDKFQDTNTEKHNSDTYKLAGLFPMSGSLAQAGVQREAAFVMSINDANERFSFNLTYETADTAGDPKVGVAAALKTTDDDGVVGIVGAARSSTSIEVASQISNVHEIAQISYSSTSPLLSDTEQFPYFARVVPSDAKQGQVISDFMEFVGWSQVAIIAGDAPYSHGILNAFLAVHNKKVTVLGVEDQIPENIRIIILATSSDDSQKVFDKIGSNNYVWILTDATAQNYIVEDLDQSFVVGVRPDIGDGYHHQQFVKKWVQCYENKLHDGCTTNHPNVFAFYTYDAVQVYANAIDSLLKQKKPISADNMIAEVKKMRLLGVTGAIHFDDNADRIGAYEILFKKGSTLQSVGAWNDSGIIIK